MKKYFICLLSFTCFLSAVCAQEAEEKDMRYGSYLTIAGIGDRSEFSDAGVSPLFYEGWLAHGLLEWQKDGTRWFVSVEGSGGYGRYERIEEEVFFATNTAVTHGVMVLREVWNAPKWKMDGRVGLRYHGFTNIRVTPAFLNAAVAVESYNTLFATGRLTYRKSRYKGPTRFLFFKRKAGDRISKFVAQASVPVLNSSWRPGFSYISDFSDGAVSYTGNNELTFGGLRLRTDLEYYYFLLNGNAIRIDYTWDVFKGPNEDSRLQMVHNMLQLGFVIRLN